VALCLRELLRRSAGADYEVHVWDNSGLEEHRRLIGAFEGVRCWDAHEHGGPVPHPLALDRLVALVGDRFEYLVLLDTDALVVADGWLDQLTGHLDAGAALVGVWRDEMAAELEPFVHVSCLAIRPGELARSGIRFADRPPGHEPGQNLTAALRARDRRVVGLRRSNAVNFHFVMGGLYGDLVYHHGAGSRPAWFYASDDQQRDEAVRVALRQAAFSDLDELVAVLRGERELQRGPAAAESVR
jgi:hypothetical protein